MKKLFVALGLMISSIGTSYSQAPELLNYQAVARDGAGAIIANQNLDVRIGLYAGAGAATLEYQETHSVSTNQYGQFSLKIGDGTMSIGPFAVINWGQNEYHVKIEIDNGSGYVDLGTSQLLSVPYALHAKTTENGGLWTQHVDGIHYNDGYVGIGTDTPDQQLSVHTTSGIGYIRVSDATSGTTSGLRMGMSGSGNAYIINDEPNKFLSIGTNGTTQMRIDESGYVGINQLTPEQQLHIKQTATNKALRLEHQSTTDFWENGIGTTTHNYKFYFNNLFRADISSVDGAYTQSSDRRLKKNIVYMGSVLERIMELKPATYNYIDNAKGAVRSTGFVAQEVEQVFPSLVRDMEDGYKGVVYDGFAVISIKAIQELNEEIELLKTELEELKQLIQK